MEKTVDGVTTKYYYDGQSILLEVRSDGLESHNIQGVNLIAHNIKGESDTLYYLYNGHADVVKLIDGAANTVNEYDYDIFGNILYQLESKQNPYKYSGYYYDDDTGYYYLRSRYYDPKIARFISEDTVTGQYNDPLSLNLYTYCQNDPITYDDLNGHWLHIAAGALIGGLVNTAITAVSDFMEDGKFNKSWKEYAGSFVEGAITGGIGAATGGASFIAAAAASAAGSVIGNAAGQYIAKGKVDVKEALFSGATDLVTMGAGKLAGNLTKKGMNKFAKTAVGENVLKKANNVKSKVLNKISGVKTKVQAVVKRECTNPELGMCFTADTLVYTKDGHKRIEDIKVGDEVYSVNVDTGEKGLKKVKQLFVNETYDIIHIYVGYSQIKSTAPHPFWVEGKGWVEAGNLLEGDKVKLYSGEVLEEIKEIRRERLEEPVKTYNFEVEDWHTYLVSENNVLVHNAGSKKCPLKFSFKSNKSNAGISRKYKVDEYSILAKDKSILGQANHINQDAAFRDIIPTKKGMSINLEGNAFSGVGTPHYNFHESLEKFWNQFRKGGIKEGKIPTNLEYSKAAFDALKKAGLTDDEAKQEMQKAISQRVKYGLLGGNPVPRIPSRIYQKRG